MPTHPTQRPSSPLRSRDADGLTLASVDPETVAQRDMRAQNMAPLFGLSSFTGSLEVTSTVPIVSLSLNCRSRSRILLLTSG